jgi:diguanylate cyclase (GGDEF)-like protein
MASRRFRQRVTQVWNTIGYVGVKPHATGDSRSVIATNQYSVLVATVAAPYSMFLLLYHFPDLLSPGLVMLGLVATGATSIFLNSRGANAIAASLSMLAPICAIAYLTSFFTTDSGFQNLLFASGALSFAIFRPEERLLRGSFIVVSILVYYHAAISWNPSSLRHEFPPLLNDWFLAVNALLTIGVLFVVGQFDLRYYKKEREKNVALLAAAQVAAQTDALTDVYNRRGIAPVLSSVARRTDYSLALVDLDRFKLINDRLGHGAGDVVLANAARTLVRSIGEVGTVARWGGEEFLVVIPAMTLVDADALLEHAREEMEAEYGAPESLARVTISVGLAHAPRYAGKEEVLRLADANLYEAKSSGRNVVVSARLSSSTE